MFHTELQPIRLSRYRLSQIANQAFQHTLSLYGEGMLIVNGKLSNLYMYQGD